MTKIIIMMLTGTAMILSGIMLLELSPFAPFTEAVIAKLVVAGFVLMAGGFLTLTKGMN